MIKKLGNEEKAQEYFLSELPKTGDLLPLALADIELKGNNCQLKLKYKDTIQIYSKDSIIEDTDGKNLTHFLVKGAKNEYIKSYYSLYKKVGENECSEDNYDALYGNHTLLPEPRVKDKVYSSIDKYKLSNKQNKIIISKLIKN